MTMFKKWFQDNAIEEVEVLIPDIVGMARGKFVPAGAGPAHLQYRRRE